MVFWAAILVGGVFVWLAVRLGFFVTWGLLFNIVVAIYVAIFLAPTVAACAPSTGRISTYCMALSMIALAGGCFAILHGISYVFLTGQFNVSLPGIFDILLAGGLGFLAGFLVLSFVALIVTATPLAEHELVGTMGLNPEAQQSNIACIAWCCDMVHSFVGGDAEGSATEAAISKLWKKSGSAASAPDTGPGNGNEPAPSPDADTTM
ncbi:MAG: CvpA family protein [Phycisphaerales bacterium]|nr:MAG: CvpA family protein [Phycisphaerales bacterium]